MTAVTNFFADGSVYERLMGRWSRPVGEVFLDWLALPPGLRWLDAGCGNGAFTEVLIARAAPSGVIGIDPSEGQIAYARSRPGVGSAEFRVGDAQSLPFEEDSFDAAAMALVISFVPEPAKAVAEMARVVRPGGTVGAYMWDFERGGSPTSPVLRALKAIGAEAPLPPSAAVATPHRMAELWRAAGLQAVESREIQMTVTFPRFDDFWDANIVPAGPLGITASKLPPAEKERLRARLRDDLPAGPDGGIAYPAFANAVKGRVRV